MTAMNTTVETEQSFRDAVKTLHKCLSKHQATLAEEGFVAELGALIHWTKQVETGRLSAKEAVASFGLITLLDVRKRLLASLEEQHRAAEEFPEAQPDADKEQERFRDAFQSVSKALEAFLDVAGRDGMNAADLTQDDFKE